MMCWVHVESSTEFWVIFDEVRYMGVMVLESEIDDLVMVDMAYEE